MPPRDRSIDIGPLVAERALLYSRKGSDEKRAAVFQVHAPRPDPGSDSESDGSRGYVCIVCFKGIDLPSLDVHGIDTLHALAQACDLDVLLRGVKSRFTFYWPGGEHYFDEDEPA